MATTEKVFVPIQPPSTTFKDDPRAILSSPEQTMYDEVLAHFKCSDPVYAIPNIEKGELMDQEKFWLSRECLLRFLRASKWKVPTAIQRLESTLAWRREFGMYDIVNAAHVEPEAVTGKEILFGYDVSGKPACYMIPSRQNTTEPTRQIQYAVWMLERSIDLMGPGVETLALLINFGDRAKNPSVSTALTVLHILQNHYPERLGLALIINVPFLINAFFKIVMPFVDPITRQKVKFNPEIFKDGFFTKDMVMKEWGGETNFHYEHDKYWPDLVSTCEERVKTWTQNWRNLGGDIGISEWEYKSAVPPKELQTPADAKADLEVSVTVAPTPSEISIPDKSTGSTPLINVKKYESADHAQHESSAESQGGGNVAVVTTAGAVSGGAIGDADASAGGDADASVAAADGGE